MGLKLCTSGKRGPESRAPAQSQLQVPLAPPAGGSAWAEGFQLLP